MSPVPLTTARGRLLAYDTGVNRRLLYLAAGDDVGCSVGLFWFKCESFYLIDPQYGFGVRYADVIDDLAHGRHYMSGFEVRAAQEHEVGNWEGTVPGRRYQVWSRRNPHLRKRLCFAQCGTGAWLDATHTQYNVIVIKDYAGFEDHADSDLSYERLWGLLNLGGIFAETIGKSRSDAAFNFAKYRYLGFTPLFNVESDGHAKIGFGQGLWLFQKTTVANEGNYRQRQRELDDIFGEITDLLEPVTIYRRTTLAELTQPGDEPLANFLRDSAFQHWDGVSTSAAFADWILARIHTVVPQELVLDLVAKAGLRGLGSFR